MVTKDKFSYIDRCKEICIPSLKVVLKERKPNGSLTKGSLTKELKRTIIEFATNNIEIRNKFYGGWIVKAPFSTGTKVRCISCVLYFNN